VLIVGWEWSPSRSRCGKYLPFRRPPTTQAGKLLAPLLVGGVDSGLFIAPNTDFIVATVDRSDAGVASGVIGTMQRVGSAIGIAVIGTVLFGSVQID